MSSWTDYLNPVNDLNGLTGGDVNAPTGQAGYNGAANATSRDLGDLITLPNGQVYDQRLGVVTDKNGIALNSPRMDTVNAMDMGNAMADRASGLGDFGAARGTIGQEQGLAGKYLDLATNPNASAALQTLAQQNALAQGNAAGMVSNARGPNSGLAMLAATQAQAQAQQQAGNAASFNRANEVLGAYNGYGNLLGDINAQQQALGNTLYAGGIHQTDSSGNLATQGAQMQLGAQQANKQNKQAILGGIGQLGATAANGGAA